MTQEKAQANSYPDLVINAGSTQRLFGSESERRSENSEYPGSTVWLRTLRNLSQNFGPFKSSRTSDILSIPRSPGTNFFFFFPYDPRSNVLLPSKLRHGLERRLDCLIARL